jgi:hypothetical protein
VVGVGVVTTGFGGFTTTGVVVGCGAGTGVVTLVEVPTDTGMSGLLIGGVTDAFSLLKI